MEIKVEKFKSIKTASVRHTGPYDQCTMAWMTLMMHPCVMPLINESTLYIGVCHDDPSKTAPEACRYDACVSSVEGFSPMAPVTELTIDGGDYAVYRHVGSYKGLEKVYNDIFDQWLPESGRAYKKGAPTLQIYRNLPINTPEENLITDVCIPLS